MRVGRIGADHEDHVGLHDRIEILRAGGLAQGCLESVAGRRVADARTGIDVVVAECGAHEFLHQPGFLVGAARGRDAADRVAPVLALDAAELAGSVCDGFFPGNLAPRAADSGPDHRRGDALPMRRIAYGKASLDAGMSVIRLAVDVRNHAHDLLALHFGAERAADAAVGASGDHVSLRHSLFDQRFLQ